MSEDEERDKPTLKVPAIVVEVGIGNVKDKGTCNFCGKEAVIISSNIPKADNKAAAICFKCVYTTHLQLGMIPAGGIRCFRCKSIDGFKTYSVRKKETEYCITGLDFKGCIKYVAKGVRTPLEQIKGVRCSDCSSVLPLWILEYTEHV